MIVTHITSRVCRRLASVAPTLPVALALLLVRAALSQMDVPTRSSYVMAVVTNPERAAAASFTSVPRSLAAAASPALAGALRSEEHTSELQSLMRISYAVFCLKKKTHKTHHNQQPLH